MYRTSPFHSTDNHYRRSPPQSNRYNAVIDDDTISIDLGRTVPQYANMGKGYKDTETLSEKDYFKMDDLFKKDRDEFLKRNDIDDEATQRFRENAFKIIGELPNDVASKYGDILTDLTNKFVQEHLTLKARYNELLNCKNTDTSPGRKEREQEYLIDKLSEKLKKYKNMCMEYQTELKDKDDLILSLRTELEKLRAPNQHEQKKIPVSEVKPIRDQEEKEGDLSLLINELKTGISKCELEEELRIKKELQQEEYKVLKQQLEDLQDERNRKSKQVLNRDLDEFKVELKTELGELFKGFNASVAPQQEKLDDSKESKSQDDALFERLRSLIQTELRLNNEQMRERFEALLQHKVNRDELEELLFRSNASRDDQFKRSMSIFNSGRVSNDCKFCSSSDLKKRKQSLKTEIEDLNEKMRLLSKEILRLEQSDELDETELVRLISERHSVRQQLKEKKYEMENFIFDDQDIDDATGEQPQESDNCHTINILRDNAQKFGISLRKNGVC